MRRWLLKESRSCWRICTDTIGLTMIMEQWSMKTTTRILTTRMTMRMWTLTLMSMSTTTMKKTLTKQTRPSVVLAGVARITVGVANWSVHVVGSIFGAGFVTMRPWIKAEMRTSWIAILYKRLCVAIAACGSRCRSSALGKSATTSLAITSAESATSSMTTSGNSHTIATDVGFAGLAEERIFSTARLARAVTQSNCATTIGAYKIACTRIVQFARKISSLQLPNAGCCGAGIQCTAIACECSWSNSTGRRSPPVAPFATSP
mmetsp:Transcript_66376/g.138357  ORF Transcript_66376/g.138357 Transcript_66376/m.138357 type:complete len:262 (-) Transcript_66376:185-970(-)